MKRALIIGLALVALIGGALTVAAHVRPKIARADLGITASDAARCEAPALPVYDRKLKQYDRRAAAADYLAYATATLNVYPNGKPKGFSLDKHSPEWVPQATVTAGTLSYQVYHRPSPTHLDALVTFRGTTGLDAADWFELALRTLAVLGAVAVIALAITVAWVGVPEVTP